MDQNRLKRKAKGWVLAGLLLWMPAGLMAQMPVNYGNRTFAYRFLHKMWRGANFMASKIEGGYYSNWDFRLLAKNHFTHCRIGGKLYLHTGDAPDYTIDPGRLENIGHAVDSCLHNGLVAIVDPLHTFNQEYTDADLPELKKIWEQVATYFADYSIDSVAFEIMNEPHNGVSLYDIIHESINSIRSVPGNEQRIIIVSGQGFSTRQALINALDDDIFPAGDTCLIGTFHYYDPRNFTKQGSSGETIWWGEGGDSDPDWQETVNKFDEVQAANEAWAQRHNTVPLPLYLGEFGVDNVSPPADLKRWLFWVRVQAEKRGYATAVWNMYSSDGSGKGIGPWDAIQKEDPTTRYFRRDPVEALMTLYEYENGILSEGTLIDSATKGFSGTGYIHFDGYDDSVLTNSVYVPKSGQYNLYVRYQNMFMEKRSLCLKVLNHERQPVLEDTLKGFVATGPDEWNMIRFTVSLPADTALAFVWSVGDPASGLLVDYFTLTKGEYYDNLFPSAEIITPVRTLADPHQSTDLVKVYPTVFRDEITVEKPGADDVFYYMTDMSGKIWFQGMIREERKHIICSVAPVGIYLLLFGSGNRYQSVRVIKLWNEREIER